MRVKDTIITLIIFGMAVVPVMLIMQSTMIDMWGSGNTTGNITEFTSAYEMTAITPLIWFAIPFFLLGVGIFLIWWKRK